MGLRTMHLAVLHRELRANTQALVGPIDSPDEGSSATHIRSVVSDGITSNLLAKRPRELEWGRWFMALL